MRNEREIILEERRREHRRSEEESFGRIGGGTRIERESPYTTLAAAVAATSACPPALPRRSALPDAANPVWVRR